MRPEINSVCVCGHFSTCTENQTKNVFLRFTHKASTLVSSGLTCQSASRHVGDFITVAAGPPSPDYIEMIISLWAKCRQGECVRFIKKDECVSTFSSSGRERLPSD